MISLLTKQLYEKKWEIHFVISSNHWELELTEQYCNTHHWNLQKRIEVRGNVNKTCPLNPHYSFTCNTWFTKSISMWRPKHTNRFIFMAQPLLDHGHLSWFVRNLQDGNFQCFITTTHILWYMEDGMIPKCFF